ncbi:hypothetical protein [Caulobacter sp. 17J80-11]|uniref:hypothetical protein n=1 Tax=Caulobacter sp. 17J80-11 TaxID=2763502 RepID=UPI0016537875|nr:hypothetical protein [Caulobacter sp. 17J80-11]MBC6981407.1 hypothetical protein [Caulobacter sp. 17J80-11]
MSFPVYRDAAGRYAVAVDHVPDEAVALERDLAAAQALAERMNEERDLTARELGGDAPQPMIATS